MRFPAISSLLLLPGVFAYAPLIRKDETNTTSYPFSEPGPDDPADYETIGYFSNRVALNTNNLTRTMDFYNNVFGFRHMFTYHLTEHFSITYMGHSQGGRNGSGYQTAEEMIRNKQDMAGMIEFVYFNRTSIGGEDIEGPDKRTSTFCFFGVVVPDPEKTQERLEKYGATIYKKVGEPMPDSGPMGTPDSLGDASGLSEEAWKAIHDGMTKLNQLNIFAADPDGNMLEISPLIEPPFFGE